MPNDYDNLYGTRKSRKEKKLKRKQRVYKRGGKYRTIKMKAD